MTAFFNGTRQLGQAVGALKDNVALTVEARTSDDTLLEQLADGDPAKLAALRAVLGAEEAMSLSLLKFVGQASLVDEAMPPS